MIASGRARDTFREIVRLQGGDVAVIDDPSRLPHAKHTLDIVNPERDLFPRFAANMLALPACCWAEGARRRKIRSIRRSGIVLHKKVGDAVEVGTPLCTVHYNAHHRLEEVTELLEESFMVGPKAPAPAGAGEASDRRLKLMPVLDRWRLATRRAGMHRLTGVLGLITMMGLAYLFSTNRSAIRKKTVAWGLGLQIAFAFFVLDTSVGQRLFRMAGDAVNKLLSYAFLWF